MNIFELLSNAQYMGGEFLFQTITQDTPWSRIKTVIDNLFQHGSFNAEETERIWAEISSGEIGKLTFEHYLNTLNTQLHSKDLMHLKNIIQTYPQQRIERIASYINTKFQSHYNFLSILGNKSSSGKSSILSECSSRIKILLLDQLGIQKLLDEYFKLLHHKHSKSVFDNSLVEYDQETSEYVRETVSELKESLNVMDVKRVMKLVSDLRLETECLNSINSYITSDMKSFVNKFQENIEENSPFLVRCEMYYDSFHTSFLKMFSEYFLEQVHISKKRVNEIKFHKNNELSRNKIYLMYGQLLAKNVFTITLMYPDSQRLVKELKKCIDKVGLIQRVCTFLKSGIENRLLTPGVVTQNILLQYINMLKVLQVIDSTGEIYDQITTPIKSYLLKRNDTLRCIINHLMSDDKENPIARLGTQLVKLPSKEFCDIESEQEEGWGNNHSLERKQSIKYQEIDLITVLVNLYGSQESFISQYQIMLAQKLMGAKDYNIDEEVINLQRLKQRFGEQALQACNIIVKDFKDSKRIDNIINKEAKILPHEVLEQKDLHTIIVSKGYWPINYEGNPFNIPKFFKGTFEHYGEKFSRIKAMRKIQFHYDLGYVNIVLTFENGDVPFRCLPIHAVIISFFDETKNKDKKVSVEYLMKQLDLSQSVVRQRLSFWIHKGVIRPSLSLQSKTSISLKRLNSYEQGSAEFYTTIDVYKKPLNSDDTLEDADDMIFKESSFEAKVKLAEDLIQKIIHFNGSKSSEQIFLLLKTVYKSEINFDFTEAETKDILKKMVGKKRLVYSDEVYSYHGKER